MFFNSIAGSQQAAIHAPQIDDPVPEITIHATTANFAASVSSAVNGDVIGLAAGDYGTWTGTNKTITIVPEAGVSPTIGLSLSAGDANFTIDGAHTEISRSTNGMVRQTTFSSSGIVLTTVGISSNPQNITIKRCWLGPRSSAFSGGLIEIDNGGNSTFLNIVFDRCYFHDVIVANAASGEAIFRIDARGITVKNCYFKDLNVDCVKLNGNIENTVSDCEMHNNHPFSTDQHTDCIQWFGGTQCTIVRNYCHTFEQAISFFDGSSGNVITDNVCDSENFDAIHWITLGGDNPASLCEHNTVLGPGIDNSEATIVCGSKPPDPLSISNIKNNVSESLSLSGIAGGAGGQPTTNTNNMYVGASSPNINGSPTFVGGAQPTTWQGYKLTSGSTGHNAGTDGLDVGIRVA